MDFIGSKGWAAPRLKDATLGEESNIWKQYLDLVGMCWKLWHRCRLVHADLSEYNILCVFFSPCSQTPKSNLFLRYRYYRKKLYIIDVSQSVEHDHPHALEFLRKDVSNVIDFFRRRLKIPTMTVKECFNFVVSDMTILVATLVSTYNLLPKVHEILGENYAETLKSPLTYDQEDKLLAIYLDTFHSKFTDRTAEFYTSVEEEFFKRAYIPRTLDEVNDFERDIDMMKRGDSQDVRIIFFKLII